MGFDAAVAEGKILRIPTDIFAFDFGVLHDDVIAVPERIFAVEFRVFDDDVRTAVEWVIAIQDEIFDFDVGSVHGEIVAFGVRIVDLDSFRTPEDLIRVVIFNALPSDVFGVTKILWGVDYAVLDEHMFAIPHPRTAHRFPMGVPDFGVIDVPKRVFISESTTINFDVIAFF